VNHFPNNTPYYTYVIYTAALLPLVKGGMQYTEACNNMSVTNVYIPKAEFRFTGRPKVIRGGKRTKFVVEHIV